MNNRDSWVMVDDDDKGPEAPAPKPLQGFERINRYWDPVHKFYAAKILPGEYYITLSKEVVITVLGSCIAACVRDTVKGIGGMNHFMLPLLSQTSTKGVGSSGQDLSLRYGDYAMAQLINEIIKFGGRRENLEVKIFGGGSVLEQMTEIGNRNITFVHEYLQKAGLRVAGEDTGGIYPRKVYYSPEDGRALVKVLQTLNNNTIIDREASYQTTLGKLREQEINKRPEVSSVCLARVHLSRDSMLG